MTTAENKRPERAGSPYAITIERIAKRMTEITQLIELMDGELTRGFYTDEIHQLRLEYVKCIAALARLGLPKLSENGHNNTQKEEADNEQPF